MEESQRKVDDIAKGMLKRYSRPKVAREMAFWHAMDHPPGSPERVHWLRVYETIIALSKDIAF